MPLELTDDQTNAATPRARPTDLSDIGVHSASAVLEANMKLPSLISISDRRAAIHE